MKSFVIIFVLIIFIGIFLILKFRKKKYKIGGSKISYLNTQLKRVIANGSYKEQIVDMDKLYHKTLIEGGYEGTFGEILKQEPSEVGNLNKIWELHKLRNKLVHEFDLLSENALKHKANDYKGEIEKLFKQFK